MASVSVTSVEKRSRGYAGTSPPALFAVALVGTFCSQKVLNGIARMHREGGHLNPFEVPKPVVISVAHDAQLRHADADWVHTLEVFFYGRWWQIWTA
jgi:hypothetical protein